MSITSGWKWRPCGMLPLTGRPSPLLCLSSIQRDVSSKDITCQSASQSVRPCTSVDTRIPQEKYSLVTQIFILIQNDQKTYIILHYEKLKLLLPLRYKINRYYSTKKSLHKTQLWITALIPLFSVFSSLLKIVHQHIFWIGSYKKH